MPDPTDVERGPVLDGAVLDGAVLDGAVLAGAVLAGGRSRRLGTDKAAVEIDGRAMADRVLDALRAVGTRPVVIGGDTPGLSAVTIADRFPGEGPVGGLSTALGADLLRDAAGVFVLACDLPWIDVAVLHTLAGVDRRSCDVVVASTDRPQPLCALWLPSARVIVDEAFAQGERAMWRVLERCRVTEVDIEQAWRLDDVDTPDDLARSTSRSTTRSVNRSADRPADGAGPER